MVGSKAGSENFRPFCCFISVTELFKSQTMALRRVIGLLLMLVTLLAYLPATYNDFINFDDDDYVTENPMVQKGLTWTGIQWAFTTFHAANWHPITWVSHMADCELFHLNPGGHHFVNILFHTANAILLFMLLLRLTGALWPGAFIAALFAWHPLHVESVAWVSERKDVLSTLFALLALLSYTRFVKENSRRSFWVALIYFALGLMSKSMLVTLPFVMLLLDYWPLQRIQKQAPETRNVWHCVLEKWPFFLLAALSSVVTCWAQKNEAVASLAKVPLDLRLENVAMAYPGYLFKAVWPAKLAVFYPLPKQISWFLAATAATALMLISAVVWRARKTSPYLLMGWLWFLGTLVPVIGLVQVGDQAMADRYTYFPLVGIFIAVTFLIESWVNRLSLPKFGPAAAATLTLTLCLVLTKNQMGYWRDSESLFTHALAVTKDNATARLNLGAAFETKGKTNEAFLQYHEALQLNPQSYEIYNNIGKLLYEMNKPEEALGYCLAAVQLNPKRASLHNNLGLVFVALGRFDEAMSQFSEAAHLDAGYASPHFQMGSTLLRQGHDLEALPHFHEALQIDPDNYQMLIYTARVLAADENSQVRNGREAFTLADRANKLSGKAQSVSLDTLAMACAEIGRFDEALHMQQQAIDLATAAGQKEDIAALQQRLQVYKNHQPWRESFQSKKIAPE